MNPVKVIRERSGATQAQLAAAAGTSQPTIAAYEAGTKSPTLRTLERLATAVGLEVVVDAVAATTREDRRSLAVHRALAQRLVAATDSVLARARRNLDAMLTSQPGAASLLEEWGRILARPVGEIVEIMTDPGVHGRALRHVTPFAGVLTAAERAQLYRQFRAAEHGQ